jgi:hypothetical protein
VIGGLWPAELSTITPETATVADYLREDLQRTARSANDELKIVRRGGMADPVRQAEEARVIEQARARAVKRVESALRHLQTMAAEAPARHASPPTAQDSAGTDIDKTQVIPAVRDSEPPVAPPESTAGHDAAVVDSDVSGPPESAVRPDPLAGGNDEPEPQESPARPDPLVVDGYVPEPPENPLRPDPLALAHDEPGPQESPARPDPLVDGNDEPEPPASPVRPDPLAVDSYVPEPSERAVRPDPLAGDGSESQPSATRILDPGYEIPTAAPVPQSQPPRQAYPTPEVRFDGESDTERLRRLLAFVVRQEPRLNWAVADYADGRTVLVTALAHGWIPAGIAIPAGVQLLLPERRTGKVTALLGDATRAVTYAPGDSLDWSAEFRETRSSVQPRELPAVDDLGWELGQATHWRDGLPRMVHTLARAAAAGTGVVDDEVDLLRVHLDTGYHQLLAQYPNVDHALLLNCLLLAATEGIVTADPISANYHLSWFHKLNAPPVGRWG